MAKTRPARERARHSPATSPLRRHRLARNLTQAEMKAFLRVGQQTYSKYEIGTLEPDEAMKVKIAGFFLVPVASLWPKPQRTRGPRAGRGKKMNGASA